MAALPESGLYLQHVSVADDLPAADYVARLPVVRALRESGGLGSRSSATVVVDNYPRKTTSEMPQ